MIPGLEQVAEHALALIHHLEEIRIQVPNDGAAHRLEHARVDRAGPRPQKKTRMRVQLIKYHSFHSHSVIRVSLWALGNTRKQTERYSFRRINAKSQIIIH